MFCRRFRFFAAGTYIALAICAGAGAQSHALGEVQLQGPLITTEKHRFERPKVVVGLMFSPDGKEMCLQERTGEKLKTTFLAFDLASGAQRRDGPPLRFPEFVAKRKAPVKPENTVLMHFLPDGMHYLTNGGTPKAGFAVHLRDAKDGAVLREFHRHDAASGLYAMSSDGKLLASAQNSSLINVSDVGSGKEIAELKEGHRGSIRGISFNPAAGQIATLGGGVVQVWDLKTAKSLRSLEFKVPLGLAYSPNGKWLAVGIDRPPNGKGEIIILDASSYEKVASFEREPYCGAAGIVFNRAGTLLASGTGGNVIQVWEISEKADRPGPGKKDLPK